MIIFYENKITMLGVLLSNICNNTMSFKFSIDVVPGGVKRPEHKILNTLRCKQIILPHWIGLGFLLYLYRFMPFNLL